MAKSHVEGLVGEITRLTAEGRGNAHGAFPSMDAAERPTNIVRTIPKRRGGCKTCDGRGCVGRCKF
jgi:hypothetical protein